MTIFVRTKLKSTVVAMGTACLLGAMIPLKAQVFTLQHNFTNNPLQLVTASGLLYGCTANGGSGGNGAAFVFNINEAVHSTIYRFTGGIDGGSSPNNLLATNNLLYGTTTFSGTNSVGMIFAMNTNGSGFTPLYSFGYAPDGSYPQAGLILVGGVLYGVAHTGGTNGGGTLFRINPDGSGYATLHWFTNSPDGFSPQSDLVFSGNRLYGTTGSGGVGGFGTIFAINTDGTGYATLHSFTNAPDGAYPYGGLTVNAGMLYGTTILGGTNNNGNGTLYSINTNGSGYKTLYSFSDYVNNLDGALPKGTLLCSGGYLYGTASSGGSGGGGTLFRIGTNGGGFTVIRSFTNSDTTGSDLESGVVLLGNSLWGTTYGGGAAGYGVLFSEQLSPVITQQPQSITVTNGNPAIIGVVATDDSRTNYQWYFNSTTLLAGQTNSTLGFASATTNQAGSYNVVVSDNFGAVTSSPALLTVITLPAIVQQPQDLTVTNGSPASFTNVASGTGPLYYQWYFNTNTLLGGGTNAILSIPAADTNQAGYYSVVVTSTYGTATSSPARLTVIVQPARPVITQQPQNATVTNGYSASFTNVASGPGTLSYQWYFNTNTPVLGGTNSILLITFAATIQAGSYSVVVSNSAGSVTSAPASLVVISTKPIIFTQPQSLTVTNGALATFSVVAAGRSPLKYQWYSNSVASSIGKLLAGKTNSTYSFTSGASANNRYYSVVITNTLGKATSSPALLTVISKPVIVTNPQPVTVVVGDPATFSVAALGANLRFQWYSNSVNTAIGARLAGKTNSTYSFTSTTNSNGRYYSVVVTNTFGATTSSLARLTVSSLPYITLQPLGASITNGDFVSFTSAAAGPGTLGYQWLFQTNVLIVGATNLTLTFTNANQPGMYSMKVTNGFGAATSSPARLDVAGRPILLSAKFDAASGSYAFSYVNLAGSTNRLWAATNLSASNFWRALATNVMATNGLWFFTDTNTAKTNNNRFYRFSTP